ncbi:MAG: M42 family metallopeptidase [Actinobacteria bacterium]|nr:MAG: M42 family metallopeptidase [Actinomycetota bacterium]
MRAADLKFLTALIDAPSPSGYEQPAAAVFREWVGKHADSVATDVMGSVHATLTGSDGGPSVMLAGHVDEIGFMVNYVTAEGYLAFASIGGVDAAVLPGMRVRVHTAKGALLGVIGRMPIHLLDEDDRKSVTKMHKLFIDLGLPAADVKKRVRVGDPVTLAVGLETFGSGMAVSRGFDDKVGAFVCARVLAEVKKAGGAKGDLVAAATVQEEIGLRGGHTSAYAIDPVVGIAVEVTHATDYPDVDKRRHGEVECGKGPVVTRGANINPKVFDLLCAAAKRAKVPFQVEGEPRGTGTDANVIQLTKAGKAAGLVSIPLRYMHTPTEVLALADVEHAVALLTRFVLDLKAGTDFTP